ncbi:CoA-acylating methylmalonate-semialdehyde dehydrogenase [Vibrio parahaemolyticus]|nr:CoA-acylating methylmalonate-semialdehyde dehydrogenase [Vibrio parahaemolyticus]EGQ8182970.1 CoA-acylating methylmalonate-semialdehyde dehydrogenase [Vibrio parahaemolyticus]EGQ8544803.1 CoA-acylating methylmalonate-semialdehyde dehydrogenase [Vibrio parahaemolyticus]EKQ5821987.1 CoA-acylating methylmalonate-semialdehyde dehydrogenase [Vibrio parahaemolyticus]
MISNFINNDYVESTSEKQQAVYDPATGEIQNHVILSTRPEVERAIECAQTAFPAWAATTPLNRSRVLFKFKSLLEESRNELAELISREHGKVFSDALGEITRGLEVVEFACGIPHLQKGEHSLNVGSGVDSHSQMMPLGVVAGISPFNFPVMVPMWMFPIAIATGNTFILKPSEKNPSASLFVADLLKQAGLPDGVFNIVQGDKEAVDTLLQDDRIQAVSFVGSTPIAEYIYSEGAKYGKRVQALGGAKNHMVVMPDADLDGAVNALMGAAYGAAGERCMAISVAVAVGDDTADALSRQLQDKLATLKVGQGYGQAIENDMGPLITKEHKQKVCGYIENGVEQGAVLVVDGRELELAKSSNGYFVGATLFDHVTTDMTIYKEEIFGPVLCIVRVDSYQQALNIINEHEYGNGTAIFTADGDTARDFTTNVQIGMVGVNVPIPVPMAFHSFGGWKRSLFGPLHMHGPDGVRFFTRMKTITTRWPESNVKVDNRESTQSQAEFVMPTMK